MIWAAQLESRVPERPEKYVDHSRYSKASEVRQLMKLNKHWHSPIEPNPLVRRMPVLEVGQKCNQELLSFDFIGPQKGPRAQPVNIFCDLTLSFYQGMCTASK